MYIKVTAGNTSPIGDFLIEVHPPVFSGLVAAPINDNGDVDFAQAINADIHYLHALELNYDQTVYEEGQEMVSFRYVYWDDPETGLTAVVTTRHIFILNDNGKTIDRV
jgi:hypothetical protein